MIERELLPFSHIVHISDIAEHINCTLFPIHQAELSFLKSVFTPKLFHYLWSLAVVLLLLYSQKKSALQIPVN